MIALQEQAETLVIGHEEPVGSEAVLRLAAGSGCGAYACELVAAAQQLDAPLITADRALLQAFSAFTRPLL